MDAEFRLGPIAQIAIHVVELERAITFYGNVLGLPLRYRDESMAFFDAGGQRLVLARPDPPEAWRTSAVVYFEVPEIRHAFQSLVERGVRFAAAPHRVAELSSGEMWLAFFYDSEQNLMALMGGAPSPAGG